VIKHYISISFFLLLPLYLAAYTSLDPIKQTHSNLTEKPLVVIIPSYNNQRWCIKNLESVFQQKYRNYHVIYIDDASTDATLEKVTASVDQHNAWDRFTLVHNTQRVGALANYYKAIHSCDDEAIIIALDGDDFLFGDQVFNYINTVYQDDHVWLTWGQFIEYPSGKKGFAADFPQEVVQNNSYRKHGMPISHLRTFYAWLFKLIYEDDLKYDGEFYQMTWDKAIMGPMVEMAAGRYKFIDEILYIYNFANPINDCRKDGDLQVASRKHIYAQEPYQPLAYKITTGIQVPICPD